MTATTTTMSALTRRHWLRTAGALAAGGAAGWAWAAAPKERTVELVAKKFEFIPPEIHVKQGETVVLQITAPEVPMGVNFADFGMRTDVVPGKPATLRLTAGNVGSYTFVCDVFCGTGHEDMSGTLIVSA